MGRTYSVDLRNRIIQAVEKGIHKKEITKIFSVGMDTINRYIRKLKQTGNLNPKKRVERSPRISQTNLEKYVAKYPDATLEEL